MAWGRPPAGGVGHSTSRHAEISRAELLASLVARSLVVAEEHGPQTRYRLLETIRQYGEQRLGQAGQAERWRARHAGYYTDVLRQVRDHAHDPDQEVFWAVRLGAEQDNLLAAWLWAIGTGNLDTAFQMLAGFAPVEIWNVPDPPAIRWRRSCWRAIWGMASVPVWLPSSSARADRWALSRRSVGRQDGASESDPLMLAEYVTQYPKIFVR